MQINLEKLELDPFSEEEISRLLSVPQNDRTDLEQMWFLMDKVWEAYGCDNRRLAWDRIGKFYSHPVWLLNGLFIEQHDLSMQHRDAISDWIVNREIKSVVDYGGGFGTIAKLVAEKNPLCKIDIYEPHPSEFAINRLRKFENINIVDKLNKYDCLISTDVLEHVPQPLSTLSEMIKSVNVQGYLIIANNFTPVIQCHLPHTFHLKYTFNFFAKRLGLKKKGPLQGSHATIYQKEHNPDIKWSNLKKYEYVSKLSYPIIELIKPALRPVKKLIK